MRGREGKKKMNKSEIHSENGWDLVENRINYGRELALYLQGNTYLNHIVYNSWLF